MKVIQVVPRISDESSGPSYSVPGLCRGLKDAGCDVSLYFAGERPKRHFDYPVHVSPITPFPTVRLGRSPGMRSALFDASCSADIIHNNSFWMFPNVYPYQVVRKLRRERGPNAPKLVNAPRGTLAAWSLKHHALQKRLFGIVAGQYAAMRATDLWHATSEKEYEEIRAAGFRQPVAIVPIGMQIPSVIPTGRAWGTPGKKKVVFFGRLHAVKNVDWLIKAWEILFQIHSSTSTHNFDLFDWELLIAGPDGGVRGSLEAYVAEHRIPHVSFVGEINGFDKYAFLSQADLYVLPSQTENFGVTLAEALACGTPSLGSKGTPWQIVNGYGCGVWGFDSPEELADELVKLMGLSDDNRKEMGERGRKLIRENYSWQSVGSKMKAAYDWLLHGGDRPEYVKIH